jgi:hypothetical protein
MNEPISTYCANHPQVETSLRCNRCSKLICTRCAVLTPTGYRCKECVRGQQKIFETAIGRDYLVAFLIAAPLSFLGSLFVPRFILFAILLSPVAGGLIAEAVRFGVQKRRSLRLFQVAAAGAFIGAILLAAQQVIITLSYIAYSGVFDLGLLWPLVGHGLYIILVTTTTFYRLSGINLRV